MPHSHRKKVISAGVTRRGTRWHRHISQTTRRLRTIRQGTAAGCSAWQDATTSQDGTRNAGQLNDHPQAASQDDTALWSPFCHRMISTVAKLENCPFEHLVHCSVSPKRCDTKDGGCELCVYPATGCVRHSAIVSSEKLMDISHLIQSPHFFMVSFYSQKYRCRRFGSPSRQRFPN